MSLFEKHKEKLNRAIQALEERKFWAAYPEHPKAYGEDASLKGQTAYNIQLEKPYQALLQKSPSAWLGEEESPFTGKKLGITYPAFGARKYITNAEKALETWRNTDIKTRAGILIEALDRISGKFFEIAYATQHTTGQSFIMSFQASGPHANDRALEAIAMGYKELTRYDQLVEWEKPMGKASLKLTKQFIPVPKGINLVIGCSTFPTWNTVPGLFAALITGNVAIVKPHPGAILPIAIIVAEIQKLLKENKLNPLTVQLAVDTAADPITKKLAKSPAVSLIDYTGGSAFGEFIEGIKGKTVFTEKAGINSVIIDSAQDLREVMRNIAFSVSLYSGQMCTAPQNIFIPAEGVLDGDERIPYNTVVDLLRNEVASLVMDSRMGAGTLGAIQNPLTLKRAEAIKASDVKILLNAPEVKNPEFDKARISAPTIVEVDAANKKVYGQEWFGPVLVVVKTKDTDESIALAQSMALEKGAITCSAYSTNTKTIDKIKLAMNKAFAPVSINFTGMAFVNQHAAFSDFHVTGGNPAGNASFTDASFINRRYVWVGNRIYI